MCLLSVAAHFSLPELPLQQILLGHREGEGLVGAAPAHVPGYHAAPIII